MWKDFKTFLMRGNVIDLAVGFVVGAAFGTIVKSLVDDAIFMPPIGLLLGKVDFWTLYVLLHEGTKAAPPGARVTRNQSRGRGNAQLRRVHQHADLVRHHRRGGILVGAAGEQAAQAAGSIGAHHQGVSVLRHGHPVGGSRLPTAHRS